MKKYRLDREEREILAAIEGGKWEIVRPTKAEFRHYAVIAKNTLRKDQRMNIRISRADLLGIKARAAEEGIPYQTLVTSVIHKYISSGLPPA